MARARTIGSGTTRPLAGAWAVAAVAPGRRRRPRRPRRARARLDSLRRADDGGGGAPRGRPLGPRSSARLRRGRLVVPVPFRRLPDPDDTLSAPLRGPGHRGGRLAQRDAHPALGEHVRRDVRSRCAACSATTTSSPPLPRARPAPRASDVRGRRGAPVWSSHQQLRWHRTTLLGRIPAWCPPVAPVGPWRPILLESAGSLRVEEADVHVELDGDDGVVRRRRSGDLRCGAPRGAGDAGGWRVDRRRSRWNRL